MPDEDKNFGGALVLDFRKRWRHVKTIYISLFWELRDKGNLKNLQFWPESLRAILEYWYIERGLFQKKNELAV